MDMNFDFVPPMVPSPISNNTSLSPGCGTPGKSRIMATPGKSRIMATPGKSRIRSNSIDLTPFNPLTNSEKKRKFPKRKSSPGQGHSLLRHQSFASTASTATGAEAESTGYRFLSGSASIPHPEKGGKGEDSFFISSCGYAVGVADGVGGWSEHGIDAGEYSRNLMSNAKDFIEETDCRNPQMALMQAYDTVTVLGSTTACIATLQENLLRVSNLGDSGILLFRFVETEADQDSENNASLQNTESQSSGYWGLAFRTKDQQHYFNCPKQLGTNSSDFPYSADEYIIECKPGDIALVATDGVTDNLSERDLIQILNSFHQKKEDDIGKLAQYVAAEASKAAGDSTRITPFALSAKEHGMYYAGGKMDDITVVAALIYDDEQVVSEPAVQNLQFNTPAKAPRHRIISDTPDTRYSSPSKESLSDRFEREAWMF